MTEIWFSLSPVKRLRQFNPIGHVDNLKRWEKKEEKHYYKNVDLSKERRENKKVQM